MRVVRDGTVIYETQIADLKRFKDDAREVAEGFECGIRLEGFNDLREGDVFEVFETREVERTSLDEPAPAAPASQLVARGRGLRRHPQRGAPFPRERLAEGQAAVPPLGEGPPAADGRGRRRGRPSRHVAARAAHALVVAREYREVERLLDESERYLAGQEWELGPRRALGGEPG